MLFALSLKKEAMDDPKQNGNGKKNLLQKVEKHLIGYIVGSAVTIFVGGVFFYFNTNFVMGQNTKDIDVLKTDVKNVQTILPKVDELSKDVNEIKDSQAEIKTQINDGLNNTNKRMDDMYKVLLELQRKQ